MKNADINKEFNNIRNALLKQHFIHQLQQFDKEHIDNIYKLLRIDAPQKSKKQNINLLLKVRSQPKLKHLSMKRVGYPLANTGKSKRSQIRRPLTSQIYNSSSVPNLKSFHSRSPPK